MRKTVLNCMAFTLDPTYPEKKKKIKRERKKKKYTKSKLSKKIKI